MYITLILFIAFNAEFNARGKVLHDLEETYGLLSGDYFVDKTEVIKAFLTSAPRVMVLAPRFYYKTVNMQLIKRYCEIVVSENGTRIPPLETDNYSFFNKNKLAIMKNRMLFKQHFAKYPVLFLDLNHVNITSYFGPFFESFKTLIFSTFDNYKYLLTSEVTDVEREYFDENKTASMGNDSLHNGVSVLASLMYRYFGNTKCMLLMDGYDRLVSRATTVKWQDDEERKINLEEMRVKLKIVVEFLNRFLFADPHIGRVMINACIKMDPFLNNERHELLMVPFLADPKYARFYGLTETDVRGIQGRRKIWSDVKAWYGGHYGTGNITIYNPYSLDRWIYVEPRSVHEYWSEEDDFGNVYEIFFVKEVQTKIDSLLATNYTEAMYFDDFISVDELIRIRRGIVWGQANFTEETLGLVFTLMTDMGHLNVDGPGVNMTRLRLPNNESREYYNTRNINIVNYYKF